MSDPIPDLILRDARRRDVPALVAMLADDMLGAARERLEDPLPQAYYDAFEAIEADPNNRALVAEREGQIVGSLQITFIPGLSRQGAWRAEIESVRVASHLRGQGIGRQLIEGAIAIARARGCGLVQLTTDKSRTDAQRLYERLGFKASHVGMKLTFA